jgi:hypothetical protein
MNTDQAWAPSYSPWRDGGWYVGNVRYPSGAVGCVSRNYADKKWRIACDTRPGAFERFTYRNRDDAAWAERSLAERQTASVRHLASALSDFGQYPPERNARDGWCYVCDGQVSAGTGVFATGSDDTGMFGVHLHAYCCRIVRQWRERLAEDAARKEQQS